MKYKKTKSIITVGPANESKEMLAQSVANGADCIRLNFSHGTHDEHLSKINHIRSIECQLNCYIPIISDTKGPEIRTNDFEGGSCYYQKGDKIKVFFNQEILGTKGKFSINYPFILKDVNVGTVILIDDNRFRLKILTIKKTFFLAEALNSHTLVNKRKINLPGVKLSCPFLSEKDKNDIIFSIKNKVDFIALSFVSCKDNIEQVRDILNKYNSKIKIISKIESEHSLTNFDEILDASDGIMVARGDLGIEVPYYKIPQIQIDIVKKCLLKHKLVIVATHMLESMCNNVTPTRAEVTDVFYSVIQGVSANMLSAESASGKYPIEAIKTLSEINNYSEKTFFSKYFLSFFQEFSKSESYTLKSVKEIIKSHSPDTIICYKCDLKLIYALSSLRHHSMILVVIPETIIRKYTFLNLYFNVNIVPIENDVFNKEYLKNEASQFLISHFESSSTVNSALNGKILFLNENKVV